MAAPLLTKLMRIRHHENDVTIRIALLVTVGSDGGRARDARRWCVSNACNESASSMMKISTWVSDMTGGVTADGMNS